MYAYGKTKKRSTGKASFPIDNINGKQNEI